MPPSEKCRKLAVEARSVELRESAVSHCGMFDVCHGCVNYLWQRQKQVRGTSRCSSMFCKSYRRSAADVTTRNCVSVCVVYLLCWRSHGIAWIQSTNWRKRTTRTLGWSSSVISRLEPTFTAPAQQLSTIEYIENHPHLFAIRFYSLRTWTHSADELVLLVSERRSSSVYCPPPLPISVNDYICGWLSPCFPPMFVVRRSFKNVVF